MATAALIAFNVCCAVGSAVSAQLIQYAGAGGSPTLVTLPMYVGSVLAAPLCAGGDDPASRKAAPLSMARRQAWFVLLTALDVVGNTLCQTGIRHAGSGLYQAVYSSVVVFTAVFSWLLLGKAISLLRWVSLGVMCAGLALVADGGDESSGDGSGAAAFGVLVTLVGSAVYGTVYVVYEHLMENLHLSGMSISFYTGLYGIVVALAGAATQADVELAQTIAEPYVLALFASLMITYGCRIVVYFRLASRLDGVGFGVLSAAQSIIIVIVSSALFCERQPTQCLTPKKALASAVVFAGVFLHAWASTRQNQARKQKSE